MKSCEKEKGALLLLGVFVILLASLTFVSAASAQKDVGYILLNERSKNLQIISVFNELNLSYDIIQDNKLSSSSINLSNYRFLFIDDVRLSNARKKTISNYNVVIMNKFYGFEWGLTDRNGLSQFTSTSPLSVKLPGDDRVPVYTSAKFALGGGFVPYYYIDDKNMGGVEYESIARAFEGGGQDDGVAREFGDVVAGLSAGSRLANGKTSKGNICFYGIAKTPFWTDDARKLLKDCIGFVATVCSSDSDCPGESTGSKFCIGNGVFQNVSDFRCVNPGKVNSKCVENTQEVKNKTCEFACLNGDCIRCDSDNDCDDGSNFTEDICVNPGKVNSACIHNNITCLDDEDCGIDGLIGNPFCTSKNVSRLFITWTCNNPGTSSSSCSNSTKTKTLETCSDACLDGQCRTIVCRNDSDCDDGNMFTQDRCVNPGTVNSSCVHNEINCFQNSDCGDNILSDLTCSGKDVIRSFTNFTCSNPGTVDSVCSNFSGVISVQTCSKTCTSGRCININCTQDSDCNDFNDRTVDQCVNPNSTASFCRNVEVNCLNDNDCGFSGFSGGEFCFDDNVFKNFQTSKCNNPGTLNSSCSNAIGPKEIQDCGNDTCGSFGGRFCKDGDVFMSRVCTNSECANGGCVRSQYQEDSLVKECSFGCTNGECNKQCSVNSDCGNVSVVISCQGSNLINMTTTPACVDGTCGVNVMNSSKTCQYGCANNACNPPPVCSKDSDCGSPFSSSDFCTGNNVTQNLTAPRCINPGTQSAFCRNDTTLVTDNTCSDYCSNGMCKNFNCKQNSDCGSPFSSGLFCTGKNVTKNMTTPTCMNPGTVMSSCVNVTSIQVNNTCSDACSNGMCVKFNCKQDSDCGSPFSSSDFCTGNNVTQNLTAPRCINPGTQSAFCRNDTSLVTDNTCSDFCSGGECKKFNCKMDSDCGTGMFTGNKFCSGLNITQMFEGHECDNPGTVNSKCVVKNETKKLGNCLFGCSFGGCTC